VKLKLLVSPSYELTIDLENQIHRIYALFMRFYIPSFNFCTASLKAFPSWSKQLYSSKLFKIAKLCYLIMQNKKKLTNRTKITNLIYYIYRFIVPLLSPKLFYIFISNFFIKTQLLGIHDINKKYTLHS